VQSAATGFAVNQIAEYIQDIILQVDVRYNMPGHTLKRI